MSSLQKKVIITGASGLLGRALVVEFEKEGWNVTGLAFNRAKDKLIKLDLNDLDNVRETIQNLKPDIILHAAAERSPDKVENDLVSSRRLNVTCAKNLSEISRDLGISFIYISTDYVFDGTNPPYSETDLPNPLNQYGLSKLDGEKAILEVNSDACVLRIPVLYGDEEYIGESAISCLIKNLQKNEPIKVSNFEIRYPSHVDDIATVCAQLAKEKMKDPSMKSVYHWCGYEPLTKYEMTHRIAVAFDLQDLHISPENNPSSGAPRPKNTQLSCERLKSLGIGHHTPFDIGVKKSFGKFFS